MFDDPVENEPSEEEIKLAEYRKNFVANHKDKYEPKTYVDNGVTFPHETDLTPEIMDKMLAGEVITIVNKDGSLNRRVLLNSFNVFRCSEIENPAQALAQAFFGVPPSPFAGKTHV